MAFLLENIYILPLLHSPSTQNISLLPFCWVANLLFTTSQSIHRFAAILLLPIHHLKSCNYRAVRPKPLPPPPISRLFRRRPVRWLLMADTAGKPPKLSQIMSSTVFCSSSPRDRWRGVLDNLQQCHQKYQKSTNCRMFTIPLLKP